MPIPQKPPPVCSVLTAPHLRGQRLQIIVSPPNSIAHFRAGRKSNIKKCQIVLDDVVELAELNVHFVEERDELTQTVFVIAQIGDECYCFSAIDALDSVRIPQIFVLTIQFVLQ